MNARRYLFRSILFVLLLGAACWGQGRLIVEKVHGTSLEKNVTGEAVDREVAVYLPPSYDTAKTKRYPAIYLLHGIGDTDKEFTSAWKGQIAEWGTIQGLMDHGVADGRFGEMIVVMPDERTKMMGSFYTNSSATGNWEDFTALELVKYIDAKYRTIAHAESRGIAGHSMGGYGAIKLGMKHPDIFSVVFAMNPAVLGWGGDLSLENPAFTALPTLKTPEEVLGGGIYAIGAMCLAQAFSPDPRKPPFFANIPFDLKDGKLQPNTFYSQWEANMPLTMVSQYVQNLKKLRGIHLDTGWEDEFTHIPGTTRALARRLTELGIENMVFEEYNGDHRNRMWGRTGRMYNEVLPYFWQLLEKAN